MCLGEWTRLCWFVCLSLFRSHGPLSILSRTHRFDAHFSHSRQTFTFASFQTSAPPAPKALPAPGKSHRRGRCVWVAASIAGFILSISLALNCVISFAQQLHDRSVLHAHRFRLLSVSWVVTTWPHSSSNPALCTLSVCVWTTGSDYRVDNCHIFLQFICCF